MYFDNIKLFNVKEEVGNLDSIFAHMKDEHTKDEHKEKLVDHMDLTYKYFLDICKEKNLDTVFINIEEKLLTGLSEDGKNFWKELLCNTIYMHDIGKINCNFQTRKMKNKKYKDISNSDSKHSMLSACIYFDYYFKKLVSIKESSDQPILLTFLLLNSYLISKHHGVLDNFTSFKDKFIDGFKTYKKNVKIYKDYKGILSIESDNIKDYMEYLENTITGFEDEEIWKSIDVYIYTKLVFSLLVSGDFYSTSHYQSGKGTQTFGTIDNIEKYYNIYKDRGIYKSTEIYKDYLNEKIKNPFSKGDINEIRTQLFIESEEVLMQHKDENIFYLEAPTGSGKTNTSINLAFKLLENNNNLNKIFYVFPFNTLIEQTKNSLDDIFENNEEIKKQIAVINSVTPIQVDDIEEDNGKIKIKGFKHKIDYNKAILDRQFLHYPIVLTSHVNFFNYFFGNSREEVFPITHIANSVVILDEIQSYRNSIWKEIIIFLKHYCKLLNIKLIIMSATLPKLEKLLDSGEQFVNLIENRDKYFSNPLFKDRVNLDFSLLDEEDNTREVLVNKVVECSQVEGKNILIEFIKKKTALDFFKDLNEIEELESLGKKIMLITGDDNKIDRNKIINTVKTEKNIILVATQVVEAGVDIDMDIGFKDISILDAEEQFSGRINRSCKKKGSVVYFFNLDDVSSVYKGDRRKDKEITLSTIAMRKILKLKDFEKFYKVVMGNLESDKRRENSKNIKDFKDKIVARLDYREITKRMKLIDDDDKEYRVFFNREIEDDKGHVIVGSEVWNEYKEILQDAVLEYGEKRVKLSRTLAKLDYFTYKVNRMTVSYNDILGNIYYIRDGEKYFIDGKFDRGLFNENEKAEIL
ncbi:CRISPR-associated helicase Cas3' [Clostridium estertheticum]|uniref:CRISPR-associated helicase Cas3' n=1 Tax=Clostridium estertheticum TaxID=238834 RepID=UPI001C0AA801|nr:CRISPR-associated helicase Cas3' [Clostridium estertheticum]MBU3187233.1 CRISPR-associated helicase Cas3' [Clostridium estertheticum]